MHLKRLIPLLILVTVACQFSRATPAVTPPVPTSTATAIPATLQPYEQYTIDFLRARTYGGGNIEIDETLEETEEFTRYSIRYPSDELSIGGIVNVPKGEGPYPVIIAIHGFVDPALYEPLDYATPLIDGITREGYIVYHPDLRNYPPSEEGDNLFRVGMTIDVLNLMALIGAKAGPAELVGTAASDALGLMGHSMGGAIALRVLTVSSQVKATVLYATMGGDEIENAQVLFKATPDPAFQEELEIAPEIIERISAMNYYGNITSPIQLHHGTLDETIPVSWAEETCATLTNAGVQIECLYYPDEDHTFRSRVLGQFYEAMLGFYEKHLSP